MMCSGILKTSAREALTLLLVPPKTGDKSGAATPAIKFFDQQEIYPGNFLIHMITYFKLQRYNLGSKIAHFKQLHKKTGIPYSEMAVFHLLFLQVPFFSLTPTLTAVFRRRTEKQRS